MIRLRLSSLANDLGDLTLPIEPGEDTLALALEKVFRRIPLNQKADEVFFVLLDGHTIPSELWDTTKITPTSEILVAPKLSGDETTRSFVRLTLVVLAIAITKGIGAKWALGWQVAAQVGASIAAQAIGFALLPLPTIEALGGTQEEESQLYAVNGQGNAFKRYDVVPKVYGTHRMFPAYAATPYTELWPDENGELVQHFYAIYDLGLGPMQVSDIRLGDTPITDYARYNVNLVDLNKPETDEGPWDEALQSNFTLYNGLVQAEALSISLNKNESDPIKEESEYRVVRTTPVNAENDPGEIALTFVNPSGLVSFDSGNNRGSAAFDLKIEFRKVGTGPWRNFNDSTRTAYWEIYGANPTADVTPFYGDYFGLERQALEYFVTNGILIPNEPRRSYRFEAQYLTPTRTEITDYRYAGSSVIGRDGIAVGDILYFDNTRVGSVISKTSVVIGSKTYYLYDVDDRKQLQTTSFSAFVAQREYQSFGEITSRYRPVSTKRVTYRKNNNGMFTVQGNTLTPKYVSVKFRPLEVGQFEVRVTRTLTSGQFTHQIVADLALIELKTRFSTQPILTDKRHVFLELAIRATGQLNGSIANLNAICSSVLDYYDTTTSTWKKKATSNPAWVLADLLTGQINKKPLSKDRLHLPSILEWEAYCDQLPVSPSFTTYTSPRFSTNFIFDYVSTTKQIVDQVTNSALASLNIVDGKYGVLIDKLKTTPVQVFTPRNSNNFSSVRAYTKQPHALRVKYIDPAKNWQVSELTVYDDGYNVGNAEIFEDVTSFACTNLEQAYRFGRFIIAQNRLRKEVITLEVDFEHLVCTRGDYVLLTQDTMKVGGTPARVKSISGSNVTIDDGIETDPLLTYGFVFRAKTGEIRTGSLTVVDSDTFTLAGPYLPEVGDLIIIGETTTVTFDCLVKSIEPNSDMGATLTLVELAPAIYASEEGGEIPSYNPGISPTANAEFAPPGEVVGLTVAENTWECSGSGYNYYIRLDWDVPTGAAFQNFEVHLDYGRGYDLAAVTNGTEYKYNVLPENIGILHSFKVLAVSAAGTKLDLAAVGSVSATPLTKTSPPSDVSSLSIDITGEVLQLLWPSVSDCDVSEYLIRYSPSTIGTWETSIPLLRVDRNTTLAAVQARTGTYVIKAVDFNGNQSDNAARAITTIPNLFNLNLIDETTDFPALPGATDRTVKFGSGLILAEEFSGPIGTQVYYSEGFYYYNNLLDLGEIYTVRLQSLIEAEGYSIGDLMVNWPTLSGVAQLYTPGTSEWDVEAQYRTTDVLNVIGDWTSLSSVSFMSTGGDDNWTEWRKIAAITDATGRIFQYRLRLLSNKSDVSPFVLDGIIRADMPDRIESYNNLTAPTTGYTVTYDPAFKGPTPSPAIQISLDNAQSGDYWTFTSKTLTGFTIQFYNKNDHAVSRVFDAQIKGFGRKNPNII